MTALLLLACSLVNDDPAAAAPTAPVADSAAPLDTAQDTAQDSGRAAGPGFDEVFAMLEDACAQCHTDGYISNFVVEDDAAATYEQLVEGGTRRGGFEAYVVPGDPDASLLLDKLGEDPSRGDVMPPDNTYGLEWNEERAALVRAWIEAGAPGPTEDTAGR